jgi:tetratricopeptide (TPR) repeat protein
MDEGCTVSIGVQAVEMLWHALDLHLPLSRASDGRRFFESGPLPKSSRFGLLRSMARTFIEANYVAVRKDAHHDPVELIASALDLAIQQWDALFRGSDENGHLCAIDFAIRIAAFEELFNVPLHHGTRWLTVERALADQTAGVFRRYSAAWCAARSDARGRLARHVRDAVLAETVVLGCAAIALAETPPPFRLETIDAERIAAPYGLGIFLLARGKFADALHVFESLLARAPGNVLALEQAARCSYKLGIPDRAVAYTKRASRRSDGKRATPRTAGLRVRRV